MGLSTETKALVLRGLQYLRGDDLERATRAFAGYTPAQMQRPHGHSGETCQTILDNYKLHVANVEAAKKEIEAL